jgi:hypothetical protein
MLNPVILKKKGKKGIMRNYRKNAQKRCFVRVSFDNPSQIIGKNACFANNYRTTIEENTN